MALITAIGDCPLADGLAKEAAEALVAAYPGHGWWVEVRAGVLIIKHLEASGARGTIGMLRHLSKLPAGQGFKRELMRAAGELLERAHLARGPRDGTPVTGIELDDAKTRKHWQPPGMILH